MTICFTDGWSRQLVWTNAKWNEVVHLQRSKKIRIQILCLWKLLDTISIWLFYLLQHSPNDIKQIVLRFKTYFHAVLSGNYDSNQKHCSMIFLYFDFFYLRRWTQISKNFSNIYLKISRADRRENFKINRDRSFWELRLQCTRWKNL